MAHPAIRRACWSFVPYAAVSLAAPLAAQAPARGALRGTVEGPDAAPIALANVRITEIHREDVTASDGTFAFERVAPGTYTVLVRAVGYRPHTTTVVVRPWERTELAVRLQAAAVELAAVVVTGTVGERAADDALSPSTVVSEAELDRRLGGTVAATLEREPGVAVGSLGPATARPVIRGLGGDRIQILEDGAQPGDISAQSADHAVAVDPLTTERIEVVRGPMGLLYGSSALGGVVNVVRHDIPDAMVPRAHGVVSLQSTSVNHGVAGGGRVEAGAGPWAFTAEAGGRTAGDTRTPDGPLEGTQVRTLNGQVGIGLVSDERHAGVSYRFFDNDYGVPGGFVGGHAREVRITMRRHALRGEAGWHDLGHGLATLRATGTFTAYDHQEREPSGDIGTSFDQEVATLEIVGRHGSEARGHQGALGVRGQYRRVATGGTLRTPDTRDVTAAAYAVEERVAGAFRIQGGLRYDLTRYTPLEDERIFVGGEYVPVEPRTFHNVSGSLGVLVQLGSALRVGVNVARAFRTPDFNELYSDGPHLAANSYDVGDPRLAAETGLGGEILARLTTPRVRAEAAGFINQLNNYIFPSSRGRAELGTQGNRPRFQYTNEGAHFVGAEGAVSVRLVRSLLLDATASWVAARFTSARAPIPIITATDTTFVEASIYPPLIPPLLGSAGLRWETVRWFAGVGVRWAGRQTRTGDFETPTDGYVTTHLSAGIRLLWAGWLHSLSFRADNVFDVWYADHLSRLKVIAAAPGRDVSMLYRLEF
jgi:iron complex outermembrane receptor protein